MRREIEHRLRQEQAVSRNDQSVRASGFQPRERRRGFQGLGLEHLQAARQRKALYRARRGAQAAARGPIRLRKNQCDVVAGLEQAPKRPFGEFRCAGEN
jgi:hypothetical protein